MKIRAFIILVSFGILYPAILNAQLSDSAINELAQTQTDKWTQFFHFSKLRKDKFKSIIKMHEYEKSKIIMSSVRVKDALIKENARFLDAIGAILSPSELNTYKMYTENENLDSKVYFKSLMTAINMDDKYINTFNQFQYNEVFPSLLTFRNKLDSVISREDKFALEEIREEVFELYDKCLLFCISNEAKDTSRFDDLNDLFLVDINKSLSNPASDLGKLIKLTHKYEDQIHEIQKEHSDKYDYWKKKTREFEEEYLLPNHIENLKKIQKDSPFASLVHLESEAIFLLLDPRNISRSYKILSLGFHHLY